jgi:hypothetical protein
MTPSSLDFPVQSGDRYRDYVAILDLLVAGMHGSDVVVRLLGLSVPLDARADGPGERAGHTVSDAVSDPRALEGSGI